RVHRDAAIVRHAAHPALAAGFADRDVHLAGVGDRTDGRHAAAIDPALLPRGQPQDHVVLVAPDDLGVGAGGARDLPALADLDLDVVNDGADRDVAAWHGVAGLDVGMFARDHAVAHAEP